MVPNNQQFGPTDQTNFSMENSSKNHRLRMIVITAIVILIAIGGYFLSRNDNVQQVIKNTVPSSSSPEGDASETGYKAPSASVIENRQLPWVEIAQANGSGASVGQPLNLVVKASSGGKDIAGYDVLLAIDPAQFEIQSITSELASFSILKFEKGTHVTITGIKGLGQNDPTIFNETPLLLVILKPIKKGESTVSVLLGQDKEKTMLVDTEVEPLTPQVGSLSVSIK
jgi:hypothetical protein